MVVAAVTGHRVLAETGRLEAGLTEVFLQVEGSFPGKWTVVSALAGGADRLVARFLLAHGARLVAVLPLPRDLYQADFAGPGSRNEFSDLLRHAAEVVQITPSRAVRRLTRPPAWRRWIAVTC